MARYIKALGVFLISLIPLVSYADQKCPNIPANAGGQCVNVGSYELFMKVQGDKGPTVVFEAGRGNTNITWNKVTPIVSQFSKAVTYDRVNLGYSQTMPDLKTPITAQRVAENLHALLHAAKLPPPYILVGHSLGGIYMQMFARLYPKEVIGVVFVDSSSPEQPFSSKLSASNPAYGEELGFTTSRQQVKKAPPFPQVPIIILTATYHGYKDQNAKLQVILANGQTKEIKEGDDQILWEGWQNQLAKLSPYSIHLYAYDSDHAIQKYQPNLVADAIYTLIKQQKKYDK